MHHRLSVHLAAPRSSRGPALLVHAGPPDRATLTTMLACAENLGRELASTLVGVRPGRLMVTELELARVVATARRTAAAILVVPGETTTRIVRRLAALTRRPVLVARSGQAWRRVLAATDLRSRGLPVVTAGAAVAATRAAALGVLHNASPRWSSPDNAAASAPIAQSLCRRLERLTRAALAPAAPAELVVSAALRDDRAILDAVVARDADLLVVGMRRPSRIFHQGCADRVVAMAPVNVLVIPLGARPQVGARA